MVTDTEIHVMYYARKLCIVIFMHIFIFINIVFNFIINEKNTEF